MSAPRVIEYVVGAELPDNTFTWRDKNENLIDFSTGYTFELRVATPSTTIKSNGIVGAGTDPNLTISIADGEWDDMPVGMWDAQVWAHRTSDSRDRIMPLFVKVMAGISEDVDNPVQPALITQEDLEARFGRSLTEGEAAQALAVISDASALVTLIATPELDEATAGTLPPAIRPVLVSMVRRGMENPLGNTSESLGDHSWARVGSVYATTGEAKLIRRAVGKYGVGMASLTVDIPGQQPEDLVITL